MKSANKLLFLTFLFLMIMPGLSWAGPKLTIKEPVFDFGFAPQKAKIAHDFWLYSTGDDTLKIVKVSPG